jgi:nitroreductase
MTGTSFISESVRHAVELAGCAPSIHNSQPWVFVLSEQRIDLYADRRQWLPATDADERDLMLSCGAALHHLRVGLADAEIGASVHRMPDAARSDLVASVVLGEDGTDRVDATLSAQIPLRRSDRRPFRPWPMPDEFKRQLIERAAEQGAFLRVIDDADARAILITAFGAAAAEQSGMPGYAEELEAWTDRPGAEGIPGSNVERPVPPTIELRGTSGGSACRTTSSRKRPRLSLSAPPRTTGCRSCERARP